MDARRNPKMRVLWFGWNDRWKMILPLDFVDGPLTPRVTYTIWSQHGGPWEVHAERGEGSRVYGFTGRGWTKFVDESYLRPGCYMVVSKYEENQLRALIFEGNGEPSRVHNPPPQMNDWLVMLRKIPSVSQIAIIDREPTIWEFKLKRHQLFNFALDKEFYHKAGLNVVDNVTLTVSDTNFSKQVTVTQSRYKYYLREGIKEFFDGSGCEPGDSITFRCANAAEGIRVDVKKNGIEVVAERQD